jgi:hypothetical protein
MKYFLTLVLASLVYSNAWVLNNGIIHPDDDTELTGAPNAGTKMSMSFATLTQAKEAYFAYILNIIN